jgi:hypothetical protein
MVDYSLLLDEFMNTVAIPEIEYAIDQQILAEPDLQDRLLLMRHRKLLIDKAVDRCRIANLEHRLREAVERLRPRLVEA